MWTISHEPAISRGAVMVASEVARQLEAPMATLALYEIVYSDGGEGGGGEAGEEPSSSPSPAILAMAAPSGLLVHDRKTMGAYGLHEEHVKAIATTAVRPFTMLWVCVWMGVCVLSSPCLSTPPLPAATAEQPTNLPHPPRYCS